MMPNSKAPKRQHRTMSDNNFKAFSSPKQCANSKDVLKECQTDKGTHTIKKRINAQFELEIFGTRTSQMVNSINQLRKNVEKLQEQRRVVLIRAKQETNESLRQLYIREFTQVMNHLDRLLQQYEIRLQKLKQENPAYTLRKLKGLSPKRLSESISNDLKLKCKYGQTSYQPNIQQLNAKKKNQDLFLTREAKVHRKIQIDKISEIQKKLGDFLSDKKENQTKNQKRELQRIIQGLKDKMVEAVSQFEVLQEKFQREKDPTRRKMFIQFQGQTVYYRSLILQEYNERIKELKKLNN